jgi:hypothetical protein
MLVAVLLPVVVGLSLRAIQRYEVGVSSPDDVLGGPSGHGVPTSLAQVHCDRHSGNGVDVGWQSSGRPIGGRDPWTHR